MGSHGQKVQQQVLLLLLLARYTTWMFIRRWVLQQTRRPSISIEYCIPTQHTGYAYVLSSLKVTKKKRTAGFEPVPFSLLSRQQNHLPGTTLHHRATVGSAVPVPVPVRQFVCVCVDIPFITQRPCPARWRGRTSRQGDKTLRLIAI